MTDRVQFFVYLAKYESHGPRSEMCQLKFLQYQQINLSPPRCVIISESERSEDPSHADM